MRKAGYKTHKTPRKATDARGDLDAGLPTWPAQSCAGEASGLPSFYRTFAVCLPTFCRRFVLGSYSVYRRISVRPGHTGHLTRERQVSQKLAKSKPSALFVLKRWSAGECQSHGNGIRSIPVGRRTRETGRGKVSPPQPRPEPTRGNRPEMDAGAFLRKRWSAGIPAFDCVTNANDPA